MQELNNHERTLLFFAITDKIHEQKSNLTKINQENINIDFSLKEVKELIKDYELIIAKLNLSEEYNKIKHIL